ncbi:MAG: DUF1573 domain-containing protein [Elusimicrobiota bacterium]
MKRHYFPIVIAVSVLILFGAGFLYAEPSIRISKASWFFGNVSEGDILEETLIIQNSGNDPLKIKIRSSCPCVVPSPDIMELLPGSNAELRIIFDTKGESGLKTEYVFIDSNDREHPHITWIMEGTVGTDTPPVNRFEDIIDSKDNGEAIEIHLFSAPMCRYCIRVKDIIVPSIEKKLNIRISIREYTLNLPENYEKLVFMEEAFGDTDNKIPVIFAGTAVLGGKKEIESGLENALAGYSRQKIAVPSDSSSETGVSNRIGNLKLMPVLAAGLIDGINPCAFGAIIFLISYLSMIMKKKRREIFFTGLSFTAGIFCAYFLLGVGLTNILYSFSGIILVSKIMYFVIGVLTFVLAVLSYKDFLAVRKIQSQPVIDMNSPPAAVTLKIPDSFRWKILEVTEKHAKLRGFVIFAFFTGAIVSVFELVCTGQIYLPTIIYMLQATSQRQQALIYLLAYSVMFIVPLLIIFLLYFWGVDSEKMDAFGKKHTAAVKVFNTLVFLFFSVYMICASLSLL